MFRNKPRIYVILAFSLVITFSAAYFIASYYTGKRNKDLDRAAGASIKTAQDVISQRTEIIEKLTYIKGVPFTDELTESVSADIIGMDSEAAEKHFREKGFTMVGFTSSRVTLIKDVDSWPPKCFVVKGDGETVNIYETDEKGALKSEPLEETEILLEYIPETDRAEIIKGKAFRTREEVDALLEELSS